MRPPIRKLSIFLLVVGGWTFYGIFFAVQSYVNGRYDGRDVSFRQNLLTWLSCSLIWVLVTPLVYKLACRFPFEKRKILLSAPVHLLAAASISLTTLGAFSLFWSAMNGRTGLASFDLSRWEELLISDFHSHVLLYFTLIGIYHVHEYYWRFREHQRRASQLEVTAAQLETQLAHAQLNALKMQIHPHFLFNTLNSISVLILEDPKAANEMLVRLSELLRAALGSGASQVVALRQELEFVRDYLAIEQARFQDRLTVQFDIQDEVLDAIVPNLILQPLVENAIKHGIAHLPSAGTIRITAERNNGSVELSVVDNGVGGQSAVNSTGIGLKNTRDRLEKLYGAEQRLEAAPVKGNGFRVNIRIPYIDR